MRAGRVWLRLPGQFVAWAYLLLFPLVGLIVSHIGFCDPDTCWHLALGRWMSQHGQLPMADPFSTNIKDFVLAGAGQPLMQHEWFADLIFYRVFEIGGAKALLVFVAALAALSLAILPPLLMVKSGMPRLATLACVATAVPACLFRLWVRPEVISFACLSLLVWIVELSQTASLKKYWLCLLSTFLLMALWANCHALFVLGIFYLVSYGALHMLQMLCTAAGDSQSPAGENELDRNSALRRLLGLTVAAVCGTLCNPWQVNLWLFVVKIVLSPQAHANKENGPLDYMAMRHFTVIPLVVAFTLAAAYFVSLTAKKNGGDDKNMGLPLSAVVLPLGLILMALVLAILFRRLTPFAVLILFASLAVLSREAKWGDRITRFKPDTSVVGKSIEETGDRPAGWFESASRVVDDLRLPGLASSLIGLALGATSTWLACTYLVKAEIPSPSRFFTPACQALEYLSKGKPAGRLLNDSKIGSMMTFCLSEPPDLFIDGRFDSYDRQLIDDYQQMRMARKGYRELLANYKIDWVIFPPATPLIDRLIADSGWRVIYQDRAAVVLSRIEQ